MIENIHNIIPTIVEKLRTISEIILQYDEQKLVIPKNCPEGLDIILYADDRDDELTLYFGEGYHQHFSKDDESVEVLCEYLFDGVMGYARIKEHSRGGKAYKFILQIKDDQGYWHDMGTFGLIFYRFWGKLSIQYLQNRDQVSSG